MRIGWFSVCTFAVAFGSYLLLAGSVMATEVIAGVGAALVTAVFATAQHPPPGRLLALGAPPTRVLLRTAAALLTDTLRVGTALFRAAERGRQGAAEWQAFRPGGRTPEASGHRGLATLLTSLAPNGFVLDLRPSALPDADHALLVHRLVSTPPTSDADWPA